MGHVTASTSALTCTFAGSVGARLPVP